jgi:hypothetical protein
MNDLDPNSASPVTTMRPPLEFTHSEIKFAVFGHQNRRSAVFAKSADAPLELLGSYPLEAPEISSSGWLQSLWDLIDFFARPVQSIISSPFPVTTENSGSGRVILVWQGLATSDSKLSIKKIFDRNAIDITDAATRADYWHTAISIAPVIAECRRADQRNKRIRAIIWIGAAIILVLLLSLAQH